MSDRFDKLESRLLGSAPVYDKFIFMDTEKEREWESLDETTKKYVMQHLKQTTSKMESKMAIETLCLAMNDMFHRLCELERKVKESNDEMRGL